jgi:FAD/FMN-containing dehydrogenase
VLQAPEPPLAIARPLGASDVSTVLKLAAGARMAVVPYGAGTGLMGGARSLRPGIVLDTTAMDSIDVRAADRLVWAGAGAVLAQVDSKLREHGLCLGHDPWTFPVATVGGPVSTNGLGYKGGRYGGMGDQVVAVEVVLADGTLLRTPAVPRRSTGPDLARLFVGAEGTLGVVTAAALRAFPVPERLEFIAFSFERFEDGFEMVQEVAALGMRPVFLDYGEEHANPWRGREESPPALYLGFEGFGEEVDACLGRARRIAARLKAAALPESEAREMWEDRHVIAERFARDRRAMAPPRDQRREGVAFDYIHVALPASQVLTFRQVCHETAAREGVRLGDCGLWTAPEMFSTSVTLPEAEGGQARLRGIIDQLLMSAQDLGGSMEYCHGAGIRLAHLMEREWGDAGMYVLRRLKAALDPQGILNPGKLGL